MQRKGIAFKLFVLMVITFSVFISSILYLQSIFFERFYLDRKYVTLEKTLGEFVDLYENSNWNKYNLDRQAKLFKSAHNITLGVFDNYALLNDDVYEVLLEDYSGHMFRIRMGYLIDNKDFMTVRPKAGDRLEAEGIIWNDHPENFTPVKVAVNNELWFNYKNHYGYQESDMLDKISGRVVTAVLPSGEDIINGTDTQLVWGAFNFWLGKNGYSFENLKEGKFIYYEKASHTKSTVFIRIIDKDGGKRYIVAAIPHQAVLEAIEIMKEYYGYVFAAIVILVAVLSYVFIIMVSRPLIHINAVADKIAHLDFSERLDVTTEDEIGSLSNSLNIMSDSLRTSMEELQLRNEMLKNDIEKERAIENMRKDFINGVSHELKTPLGIMKSYAEALQDGIGKTKQPYYAAVILDEIDRMNLLLEDMMEVSKLQSGIYKLKYRHFDLAHLIANAIDRLEELLSQREMNCKLVIETESTGVWADEGKIEMVINNLLSNAFRYGRSGGNICITLSEAEEEGHLHCSIINDGEAIPEDKLKMIWEKFYRLESSRNKVNGGSGLGLAIVKNIMLLHKTHFGVENLPSDQGVNFFFELECRGPVAEQVAPEGEAKGGSLNA